MGSQGGGGLGGSGSRSWVPVLLVLVLLLALGVAVGLSAWRIGYGQASTIAAFKIEKAVESARAECRRELDSMVPGELKVGSLMRNGQSRQAVRRALRQDREAPLTPPLRPVHLLELLELNNESVVTVVQQLHDHHGVRVFVGPESLEDLEELLMWARGRPSPRSHLWFVTPTSGSTSQSVGGSDEDVTVISLALEEVPLLFMQMERKGVNRVLPVLDLGSRGREVAAQLQEMVDYMGITVDPPLWYSPEVLRTSPPALDDLFNYISDYVREVVRNYESLGLLMSGGAELGEIASAFTRADSNLTSLPWFVTSSFAQPSVWKDLEVDHRTALESLELNTVMFTGDYHSAKEWRKEVLDEVSLLEGSSLDNPYQTAMAYDAGLISARIGPWTAESMKTLEEADKAQARGLLSRESYTWSGITGVLALTSHLERVRGHFVDLVLHEEDFEDDQVLNVFKPYIVRGRFHAMREDYPGAMLKRSMTSGGKNLRVTTTYSPGSRYNVTGHLIQELSRALPNCSSTYIRYTVSDPASIVRTAKKIPTDLLEDFQVSVSHDLSLDVICLDENRGKGSRHAAALSLKCPSTWDHSTETRCSLTKPVQCSFRLGSALESLGRCIGRHA